MLFTLKIVEQEKSGIIRVAASGEAAALTFPSADSMLFDEILGPDWASQRVLLNMDQVHYLNSSAIGWLLNVRKTFRAAGGRLVLHSLQPQVLRVLDMLKIGKVIPLAADLKEAHGSCAAPAAAAASAR